MENILGYSIPGRSDLYGRIYGHISSGHGGYAGIGAHGLGNSRTHLRQVWQQAWRGGVIDDRQEILSEGPAHFGWSERLCHDMARAFMFLWALPYSFSLLRFMSLRIARIVAEGDQTCATQMTASPLLFMRWGLRPQPRVDW